MVNDPDATYTAQARVLSMFGDAALPGAVRAGQVLAIFDADPQDAAVLRSHGTPTQRLGVALAELTCAVLRGDIEPAGGWTPEEASSVAGLIAELWGRGELNGAAFAGHHVLVSGRAGREDVAVFVERVEQAGFAAPETSRRWPSPELLRRLDDTLREPLADLTNASLDRRIATISGWVSLGGGNRLLAKMLKGSAAQRSVAVCCYALFGTHEPSGPERFDRRGRDVLRRLVSGDLRGALALAHELTGIAL